jgi:hypothetical protein
MSDPNADYIAQSILGSYSDRAYLEKAVETGARGAIKRAVDYLITKRFPSLSGVTWILDIVVDMVCDYFGW